ncbi:LytTR family DNA-binding domain-containing protein [soil metagenome]
MPNPTALIAEDEPLLAQALRAELAAAWPELDVVGIVGDGRSAVKEALRLLPQILFFDIRMPGLDGLGAAAELADTWPTDEAPMPQLVFVTAYDEYATRAFEAQAIDYVLKPVQGDRLRKTVARLKQAVAATVAAISASASETAHIPADSVAPQQAAALEQTLAQWRQLLAAAGASAAGPAGLPSPGTLPGTFPQSNVAPLKFIAASDAGGATVRMVPIDEVLYFEAADKYVRVLTEAHEYLIRTPLKQLMPQLDANMFWQVHRAVVVRSDAVDSVHRDEAGKLHLVLRGRPEHIPVSRLYAHLFRAM